MNIEETTFPDEFTINDVCHEIQTWKVDDNPRISCSHAAIIKKEVRAHKVATCLEIVNEHTGELHHYAIEIHNIHKYKSRGWEYKEKYRIDNLDVFNSLTQFFNAISNSLLGTTDSKKHLISESDFNILKGIKSSDKEVITSLINNEDTYKKLIESGGLNMLKDVLELSIKQENAVDLIQKLKELDPQSLKELNSLAGVSQLKSILEIWENNKNNKVEEFWQNTFAENSWVLSQLFAHPVVMFAGIAYIGGKWLNNSGGGITDYIMKNDLTDNVIIIEIKTPKSGLLGNKYRGVFPPSSELSGASIQILNYKETLQKEFANIVVSNRNKPRFDVFNPKCILIIGNYENEIGEDDEKRKGFELFRANSNSVEIITFDEVFKKTEMLISLLEG